MHNFFFSRHEAQAEMVEAIGGRIDRQFRGTISGVRRDGDLIRFTETMHDGERRDESIPVESLVVLVGPLPLQEAFLKTRVSILLIPQNRREVTADGGVVFNYAGLLRVHEIRVITSQWDGAGASDEERVAARSAFIKQNKEV